MRSQARIRDRGRTDSAGASRPRRIATIANKSQAAGAVSVSVASAFNVPKPAAVFSASGLPTGCTINSSTGLVTGTATVGVFAAAKITCRNGYGVAESNTFTWTIT